MSVRPAAGVRALVAAAVLAATAAAAQAGSLRYCDRGLDPSAAQKDTLLRFAALLKRRLDAAGTPLVLLSRSGMDLSRLGVRYSHTGFSLRDSPNGAWSVRQLYFACDEGRSRLFDQGIPGFVFGTDDPALGYVSMLLLPEAVAAPLARVVLDKSRALALLAPTYSANAHAFSLLYQNCNQWVAEMLAEAWSGRRQAAPAPTVLGRAADADDLGDDPAAGPPAAALDPRAGAQRWLAAQGYVPETLEIGWRPLVWLAGMLPWLHNDDHPDADLGAARYRISLPTALEAFVRARVPGAERIEFCHRGTQVVVHRGWSPVAEGCRPGEGDEVLALD